MLCTQIQEDLTYLSAIFKEKTLPGIGVNRVVNLNVSNYFFVLLVWQGHLILTSCAALATTDTQVHTLIVYLPLLLGPGEGFGRSIRDGKMRGDGGGGRVAHPEGPINRHDDVPDRFRQEPSEFSSQQSDRFHYKSWDSNPEHVPKGRAYFEVRKTRDDYYFEVI